MGFCFVLFLPEALLHIVWSKISKTKAETYHFFFFNYSVCLWGFFGLIAACEIFRCGARSSLQLWREGFLSLVVARGLQGEWAL